MKKKLPLLQSIILFIGTVFAYTTVFIDFRRFYGIYGTYLRINDCVIPNPVTTPCFYGAFAFLIAFILSIKILKDSNNSAYFQKILNYLLIGSTLFAWGNFLFSAYKFYSVAPGGPRIACSGVPTTSPFTTPCFIGASIFLLVLIISRFIKLPHHQKSSKK